MTRDALPGDASDAQARYIEAAVAGVLVGCLYAPNGNPQPGPKFAYKLAWHARLEAHAAELLAAGVPVVLAGDYNIVPEPRDIYPTTSYDGNALIQPESRAAYGGCWTRGGPTRSARCIRRRPVYTFWDYRRMRWERDGGMRLDHFLLSPELAGATARRGRRPRACAGARTPATTRRSGSRSRPAAAAETRTRIRVVHALCTSCAWQISRNPLSSGHSGCPGAPRRLGALP